MSTKQTTVLKFGGSVLRDEHDLPRAIHDIYRHWRRGEHVLVVVSAFGATTDELIERSNAYGTTPDAKALAALLHTGEAATAAFLSLALDRAGLPSRILTPEQAGLKTSGESLDSEPVSADVGRIRAELEHAIVIVSGYAGVTDDGDISLLGRGGSDYSALFLGQRLGARCVLVKDVAGLYDADPHENGGGRLFATASYETARLMGGELVQHKALSFAERLGLEFEIFGVGTEKGTVVGKVPDEHYPFHQKATTPVRVAVLGYGTVGGGVYQRLISLPGQFRIVGVVNLDPQKALDAGIAECHLDRDARRLIEKECDVVVELIGGLEPARSLIKHALRLGRHVVTANKALLAEDVGGLERLASENGVTIRYSASVGGALPALEAVTLAGSKPASIAGIVNGTSNFICDQLSSGVRFDSALRAAQHAGYAEADPRLDIDGTDAAQKLVLLARSAFGVDLPIDSIEKVGIEGLSETDITDAKHSGHSYKLIAECRKTAGGFVASVKPSAIPSSHPFASTTDNYNCLLVETEDGRSHFLRGRGAGRYPTTEAVIADLFDIRSGILNASTPLTKEVAA